MFTAEQKAGRQLLKIKAQAYFTCFVSWLFFFFFSLWQFHSIYPTPCLNVIEFRISFFLQQPLLCLHWELGFWEPGGKFVHTGPVALQWLEQQMSSSLCVPCPKGMATLQCPRHTWGAQWGAAECMEPRWFHRVDGPSRPECFRNTAKAVWV